MYGRTYIAKYRKDIEEYFNEGVDSATEKRSPVIMLEKLKGKYPGRYSLPGENEIRVEISSLMAKKRSAAAKVARAYTAFIEEQKTVSDHRLKRVNAHW